MFSLLRETKRCHIAGMCLHKQMCMQSAIGEVNIEDRNRHTSLLVHGAGKIVSWIRCKCNQNLETTTGARRATTSIENPRLRLARNI